MSFAQMSKVKSQVKSQVPFIRSQVSLLEDPPQSRLKEIGGFSPGPPQGSVEGQTQGSLIDPQECAIEEVESWDDDNYVTYDPLNNIENRNIIRNPPIKKSKAQKRAFRNNERLRMSKFVGIPDSDSSNFK